MRKNIKSVGKTEGLFRAALTMPEAAAYIGVKLSYLKQHPTLLKYVRIGPKLKRYRIVDLDEFLESNLKGLP